MKVEKLKAIALFEALGYKTASSWGVTKLTSKIKKLPETAADTKIKKTKMNNLLKKILTKLENGDNVIVFDPETVKEDKARAKAVKDAEERQKTKKDEKKDKEKKKAKRAAKKAAKEKKKKEPKKPGVIATIFTLIKTEGPISKEDILKKLGKAFPERETDSMMKTINVQVPGRMSKEKGVNIVKTKDGKFKIKK